MTVQTIHHGRISNVYLRFHGMPLCLLLAPRLHGWPIIINSCLEKINEAEETRGQTLLACPSNRLLMSILRQPLNDKEKSNLVGWRHYYTKKRSQMHFLYMVKLYLYPTKPCTSNHQGLFWGDSFVSSKTSPGFVYYFHLESCVGVIKGDTRV